MADVVQQGRTSDQEVIIVAELKGGTHPARDRERPKRMFQTRVIRSRIDEVRQPELMHTVQPLKFVRFQKRKKRLVDAYTPVHGVTDYLVRAHSSVRECRDI